MARLSLLPRSGYQMSTRWRCVEAVPCTTRHPGPAIALEARIAQSRDLRRAVSVRQISDSLGLRLYYRSAVEDREPLFHVKQ